ncbi:regulator of chromosome condensation [Drosophila tropicalis]|uniref:regulator of chromosome condensation n=1 Tax=Drosophila tropicalis TaxID=46794 RepID=UPI0035AC136A
MPKRRALSNTNNADEAKQQAKRSRVPFHLELPNRRHTVGKVLVCGTGDTGQLGLGEDIMERKRLTPIETIAYPVDICAGGMHNLVLTNSGEIYSFGCNDEGALGRDTTEEGSESSPGLVYLPGKALKISAGDSHSACLLEDGRVFAWGSFRDSHGNMGLTIDGNKRMPINLLDGTICVSIASGADHLVILTNTGKVYTVGCAEQGQLGRISERSVSGEGRRGKRDLLRPDQLIVKRSKPIEAIWATNYCTFLRESITNTIWAVGLNNYWQLAHDKEVERVLLPVKTHLKHIRQISGGQHHTLLLDDDLRCLVVGRPEYGRLGLGDVKEVVSKLTAVPKIKSKLIYVGCGECCSYAIDEDGKLYTWGMGSNNQLGVGDGEDELEPVLVQSKATSEKRILLADGGGQHSIFLVEVDQKVEQKENVPKKKAAAAKKKETAATAAQANDVALPQDDKKEDGPAGGGTKKRGSTKRGPKKAA